MAKTEKERGEAEPERKTAGTNERLQFLHYIEKWIFHIYCKPSGHNMWNVDEHSCKRQSIAPFFYLPSSVLFGILAIKKKIFIICNFLTKPWMSFLLQVSRNFLLCQPALYKS